MSLIVTLFIVVLVFVFELRRKKQFPVDAFSFVIFFYLFIYFVIPEILPLSDACAPFCAGVPWTSRVVALVGLGFLAAGYFLSYGLPLVQVSRKIEISEKREYRFILLLLFVAIAALYLYAYSYGGFVNAFSLGAVNRLTGSSEIEVGMSSVAQYFVGVSYIVFAISQYKLYQHSGYKNKYIFLLVAAVMVVASYGLIKAGRGSFFSLLMISIFIHFNVRGLRPNLKKIAVVILVIAIGLWFVTYGKKGISAASSVFRGETALVAFSSMEKREAAYIYGRFIAEFSHPIKSLGVVIGSDIDFNMMKHFWVAPLHLVPTRLLGVDTGKPYRISEVNTELLTGSPDGGIPPGLVASFWYGGGLLGVISGCIFFGVIIGWMQRQCYKVASVYPSSIPIVLYVFYQIPWFVFNGDLSVFLKHQFDFLFFLFLLAAYSFFCRIRIPFRNSNQIANHQR